MEISLGLLAPGFNLGQHASPNTRMLVVDCPPTSRTIRLVSLDAGNRLRFFLRFPYLRFLVGYTGLPRIDEDPDYAWSGFLALFGSIRPFGDCDLGFALPLPNMSRRGCLTCPGTMYHYRGSSLETLARCTVEEFWCSAFSPQLDQGFPTLDGGSIDNVAQWQRIGLQVYTRLPPVRDWRLLRPR